jgi:putative flippase GtrA
METTKSIKVIDIIFALICGRVLAFVANDFLKEYGMDAGIYRWTFIILLPLLSLFGLWVAFLIGKKLLFVFQGAKHILIGIFATVADLKFFEFLSFIFSLMFLTVNPNISKGVSFLVATSIKYWGNKYWAFEKPEKDGIKKEVAQFLVITAVGLVIDVGSFYYFNKVMGPQFGMSFAFWQKVSVILAAIVSAVWNFLGYKFIVFKK